MSSPPKMSLIADSLANLEVILFSYFRMTNNWRRKAFEIYILRSLKINKSIFFQVIISGKIYFNRILIWGLVYDEKKIKTCKK